MRIENKCLHFFQDLKFLALSLYHGIQVFLSLCHVSRVSQEEVKKWAESLENLISHECKSDGFLPC